MYNVRPQGVRGPRGEEKERKKKSYQSLLVVVCFGVDAHDHPDLALPIKVVLEEVGHFGVPVRNHLHRMKTGEVTIADKAKAEKKLYEHIGHLKYTVTLKPGKKIYL